MGFNESRRKLLRQLNSRYIYGKYVRCFYDKVVDVRRFSPI
jgi:hypothetical protein